MFYITSIVICKVFQRFSINVLIGHYLSTIWKMTSQK